VLGLLPWENRRIACCPRQSKGDFQAKKRPNGVCVIRPRGVRDGGRAIQLELTPSPRSGQEADNCTRLRCVLRLMTLFFPDADGQF
jgi:hypothetical protein